MSDTTHDNNPRDANGDGRVSIGEFFSAEAATNVITHGAQVLGAALGAVIGAGVSRGNLKVTAAGAVVGADLGKAAGATLIEAWETMPDGSLKRVFFDVPGPGTERVYFAEMPGEKFSASNPLNSSSTWTVGLGPDKWTYTRKGSDLTVVATAKADHLVGDAGNNLVNGNGGNDDISGAKGNDHLQGGAGNDILRGNTGNDALTGGAGLDTMFGGSGNDLFVFNGSPDRVRDFSLNQDHTRDMNRIAGFEIMDAMVNGKQVLGGVTDIEGNNLNFTGINIGVANGDGRWTLPEVNEFVRLYVEADHILI